MIPKVTDSIMLGAVQSLDCLLPLPTCINIESHLSCHFPLVGISQNCSFAKNFSSLTYKRARLRKKRFGFRYLKEMGDSTVGALAGKQQASSPDDVSALAHILEPIHKGDTDLLLIYCPGALQTAEGYFPLMREIQGQLSLRLWVVVFHCTRHEALSTEKIEGSIKGIIERLKEKGFRPGRTEIDNVFIGGHSVGAWGAREVAVRKAQGFIQMGSWFDPKVDNLAQHPKPVLTLGGGLDGQMTPAVITKHSGDVLRTESFMGKYNTYATKPVIIIPGMNHAQFSDGRVNFARGDLEAVITIEEARSRTAELVAAFLAVQSQGVQGEVGPQGFLALTKGVQETHRMYNSFYEALENQGAGAVTAQLHIAATANLTKENVVVVHHDFVDNFVISKPWIDEAENRVFITTYLANGGKHICNLWVKMKSREALSRQFDVNRVGKFDPDSQTNLGKELNSKTFDMALTLVPEESRKRFVEHGKTLKFVDDWIVKGPATEWIESDLTFTPSKSEANTFDVRTPVILTPVEGLAPRFCGMHYMKLLTLARAMQWIMLDSHR